MKDVARPLAWISKGVLSGAMLLLAAQGWAQAVIPGVGGPAFDLTAGVARIDTPDGDSLHIWGYAVTGAPCAGGAEAHCVQYPGPTLIVNQHDAVTVTLHNDLPENASIIFPGQSGVTSAGGDADGLLTREAAPGGTPVTYSFTASKPGTYLYQTGTHVELQVEMGLVGALIVRPAGFDQATNRTAYGEAGTEYVHEYLYFLTEMVPEIHQRVEFGFTSTVDNTIAHPVLWFINGRNAPDDLEPDFVPWLPHQPYSAITRMHPGEKVLLRLVGGGRQMHPFHHHGNNTLQIARDGRLLQSAPGVGPDLAVSNFTVQTHPGGTYDALFDWTGKDLGWDIYGTTENPHDCEDGDADNFDDTTSEWCPDHGKAFPVTLPALQDLTFGGFYHGSPFLGVSGPLPPGEGGLNPTAGLFFMWHSHTERELTNNDIFPGGMLTMALIEPHDVPIP